MFCKKCGAENLDSAKFCKGCGGEYASNADHFQPSQSRSETKKSVFTMISGGGIILSAAGSGILIWMAVEKIFLGASLSEKIWPLMGVFLIIIGIQMFSFAYISSRMKIVE